MDNLSTALERACAEVERFHSEIRDLPVSPGSGTETFREALDAAYDLQSGSDVAELVSDVAALLRDGIVHVTHPRYFGLFNPSVLPAAIAGDLLAAAFNPQLAAWTHAPGVLELERLVLLRLSAVLGFDPAGMHATFTSGGAEANLSAVLAAVAHASPESGRHGIAATGRRPVLYLTGHSHHSFVKIARMTGLGTDALRQVPTGPDLLLDPDRLEQCMDEDASNGLSPLMVVATAGATSSGHIDPLDRLADVATERGVWYHVDAAWGAAAALSPRLKPLLAGIERADSVTWDAHKWLSVPMAAGMFFCRHPEAVRRAFDVTTEYMPGPAGGDAPDPYRMTVQWSRRAIGLKVFMAIAAVGLNGYRELIEHQAAMGDMLRSRLLENGWELANRTPLPVVCFTHPLIKAGRTSVHRLLERIEERRRVWISATVLDAESGPVLRACITSYRTAPEDIEVLIDELGSVLAEAG